MEAHQLAGRDAQALLHEGVAAEPELELAALSAVLGLVDAPPNAVCGHPRRLRQQSKLDCLSQ